MTDTPQSRYKRSDKGKASARKYATSPQGTEARKAAQARYRKTQRGIEARRKAQAAYRQRKKLQQSATTEC